VILLPTLLVTLTGPLAEVEVTFLRNDGFLLAARKAYPRVLILERPGDRHRFLPAALVRLEMVASRIGSGLGFRRDFGE
jgi:hypothetical protein